MSWKIEQIEKLEQQKRERIQREVEEEEREDALNMEAWRKEADVLFLELRDQVFDPNDKWQYRKGLRLAFLGTKTGNLEYKMRGLYFYQMICNEHKGGL